MDRENRQVHMQQAQAARMVKVPLQLITAIIQINIDTIERLTLINRDLRTSASSGDVPEAKAASDEEKREG